MTAMQQHVSKYGFRGLLAILLLFQVLPLMASNSLAQRYTDEHPLVFVSNWDFPPYEFNDSYGEPTGYFHDVLSLIFKRLGVKFVVVSKDWDQAVKMFEREEAQFMVAPVDVFSTQSFYPSKSVLGNYNLRVMLRRDDEPINTMEDLQRMKTILVKFDDTRTIEELSKFLPNAEFKPGSEKSAMSMIVSGRYDYFVWGSQPLRWKIREMGLDDELVLSELRIPVGELHMVSHDKELIDMVDNTFALMEQSGELRPLVDKWFYPENVKSQGTYSYAFYVVSAIVLLFLLAITSYRIRKRVSIANRWADDLDYMMKMALHLSDYSVIVYDIQTKKVVSPPTKIFPGKGIAAHEVLSHIHPDDRQQALEELALLRNGEKDMWEINVRYLTFLSKEDETPQWIQVHGHALLEKGRDGKVHYIVFALKDVTDELKQEQNDSDLASRFEKMFESSMVAMSFYDKDGFLIDLNEKMRELCGFDQLGEDFFRETRMFDMPLFKGDFDPKSPYHLYACQRMHYEDANLDKFIEFRVLPIYEQGELQYYLVTARDVTAERNMYMQLYKQDAELHVTNTKILQYERELHYLLENSQMWVWTSDLKTKTISFSRTLREKEYVMSFDDYLKILYEDQVDKALEAFGSFKGIEGNVGATLHFKRSMVLNEPQWLTINGIAVYDDDGNLTGHFGIVRDVTKLIEAQELLRRETRRAEDSGKMKSIFLANMTHEIRTPLNAIVGFSDLLQMIEGSEERREFIRIIRNNCDMLIRLINDIIEASSMGQGPLAIQMDDVDFAVAFDDVCQSLAQRVQEPGVKFIVDNPYASFKTRVDKGRMQQVITNFTTNAVKYTHQGYIKVGYSYLSFSELKSKVDSPHINMQDMPFSGIFMYCEDTGSGIPKEKQDAVFERFVKLNDYVQGTGLGLSICKSIAERCAGRIGVISDGKNGSTFWIWIPCIVESMELRHPDVEEVKEK